MVGARKREREGWMDGWMDGWREGGRERERRQTRRVWGGGRRETVRKETRFNKEDCYWHVEKEGNLDGEVFVVLDQQRHAHRWGLPVMHLQNLYVHTQKLHTLSLSLALSQKHTRTQYVYTNMP